jgi:hypothetical protein
MEEKWLRNLRSLGGINRPPSTRLWCDGTRIYTDWTRIFSRRDAMAHGFTRIGHGFLRLAALFCRRWTRIYTDSKRGSSFEMCHHAEKKSVSNPFKSVFHCITVPITPWKIRVQSVQIRVPLHHGAHHAVVNRKSKNPKSYCLTTLKLFFPLRVCTSTQ